MCIVIDLDVVCLVCLHNSQQMHGIFAPDAETPDLQIAHKISTLSKLKVSADNESLPDKICDSCLEDLRAAWRFHKNCQTAAVVFQSIFRPKMRQERAEATSSPQEMVIAEGNEIAAAAESSRVSHNSNADMPADDCNDSMLEVPLNEPMLDVSSQDLQMQEVAVVLEDTRDAAADFLDMNQSIVEEDYLSVPETAEEGDIVEYYLTEEDISKKPSTSKKVQKLQSSAGKSLLKSKQSEKVLPSTAAKTKQAKPVRARESRGSLKLPIKLKPTTVYTQHVYQNSDMDDDFELVEKNNPAQKRKLSPEPKAPKICEICGNSYRYQHALSAHMRRHFQEKPFPCELCDKAFVSNVELRRHMRVHTGHKPYGCSYCDRRFSDYGSRIKHERTHTGERPYQCGTCGKSFAYPHVLSVHLRTHTGEKRFCCELCTKGFTKKAYLLTHMEQHHSGHESKVEAAGPRVIYDDTISEAGEDNDTQSIYIAEYVNEGGPVSHEEEDEEEVAEEASQDDGDQEEEEEQEAGNDLMSNEDNMDVKPDEEDDDDNEGDDEFVEVQIDDYTIRVR